MSLISGCQEGKGTPRLAEVKCPKCGEYNLTHRVCSNCGYYKGEEIVAKSAD